MWSLHPGHHQLRRGNDKNKRENSSQGQSGKLLGTYIRPGEPSNQRRGNEWHHRRKLEPAPDESASDSGEGIDKDEKCGDRRSFFWVCPTHQDHQRAKKNSAAHADDAGE